MHVPFGIGLDVQYQGIHMGRGLKQLVKQGPVLDHFPHGSVFRLNLACHLMNQNRSAVQPVYDTTQFLSGGIFDQGMGYPLKIIQRGF